MKTRGAIIRKAPGKYEVVDLEVDDPRAGELRVKMVASGLLPLRRPHRHRRHPGGHTFPFAGGHEGGGIVQSVGPNTLGSDRATRWSSQVHTGMWPLSLVRHRSPEPVRPRRNAAGRLPVRRPGELPAAPG